MEREKSQKIQLVYGYAVCLVAVIAFLISISDMVSSSIDLKDNAFRSLIVSGLITIICIILFITHWVWMRKLSRKTN